MSISVVEAGRLGGKAVLKKKGRDFFSLIGKMGQKAMRDKYPGMARVWGKLGGRPKKPTLAEIMGETGQIIIGGGLSGSASNNARLPHQEKRYF